MSAAPDTDALAVRLLTVTDAAEMLGVSRHYVYRRINDGTLRSVQLGTGASSKTRVRESDLAAFIDDRTTGPARGTITELAGRQK